MNTAPDIINAVIGYPLTHTRSPELHASAYRALKLDAATVPLSSPSVRSLVADIRALPIRLVAVTMPFKTSIIPLLDRVDRDARRINAVNTILKSGGKLVGYNTDLDGIRYALRSVPLKRKSVLLLGAGGAARAVASVIAGAGGKLMYANRTPKKASRLARDFGGRIVSRLDALKADDIDVIVNATPIGMYPETSGMPLPAHLVRKGQAVFDLVYNPVETCLLKTAKRKGAKAISGLDMFVVQGLRQVELMSGHTLITSHSVARARRYLKSKNI